MSSTQTETVTETVVNPMAKFSQPKDLVDFSGQTFGDWRDEFHKNGCVVLKGVITPEKAEYYRKKQLKWLHNFELGFDENDPSTWTAEHLPVSFKGGMYFAYAAPHESMAWEARSEPAIIDVFEKLWGTRELLCSFDGMNISMPNRKDVEWSPWPHCDQNPARLGMQAVQGLLNYAPNGPKDGGLMLMKGSAALFEEFFSTPREFYAHEDAPPPEMKYMDLFLFKPTDLKWFEDRGCEMVKINMEPGDFVLWDSRTMHYACLPEGDTIRHVQYVCMTPQKFVTEEQLKVKQECFKKSIGTTHWPHCNIRPAAEPPMRDGKVCPKNRSEPFEKPVLTDDVLRLAGVKAY